MRPLCLTSLLLTGCMEFGLGRTDDPTAPTDQDPTAGVDPYRGPETCNGVDDDGDGRVDEGFDDVDNDGVADCVDETCEVRHRPAALVSLDEDCTPTFEPVDNPWDLAVEWHWRDDPTVVMPAIANLTDDDHDGIVDAFDLPDVVITSFQTGEVIALSGDGSGELWRAPGFRRDSGVAIGDVDADGQVEVVGISLENRVRVLEADGSLAWESADTFGFLYPVPTIADLQGDGLPEIIADLAVVSGLDGRTLATLDVSRAGPWRAPVVADLDGDGLKEILLANRTFDHTGALLWEVDMPPQTLSAFPALIQADDDAQAEIAWAVGPELHVVEHDGQPIAIAPLSRRGRPGPPCVGDLDGDGQPEIAVPASDGILAFEANGVPKWTTDIHDSSGSAGCAVYDMDGDQAFEVVYADMDALMVLDGETGAIRYRNPAHGSVTYFETPTIADLDLDGSAEIITSSSGYSGYSGVTVFGHVDDGWPASGPVWPVHDFQLTNITAAGAVPRHPEPAWREQLVFRGRPATDNAGLADLSVGLADVCVASCLPGGLLRLSVQVWNEGDRDAPAGTQLLIEGIDGKVREPIHVATLPRIPAGTSLASFEIDLPWTKMPAGGLEIRVDPDDRVAECDETDNETRYRKSVCGP